MRFRIEREECRKRIQDILEKNPNVTLKAISKGQDQNKLFYSPGMRTQANKMLTEQ